MKFRKPPENKENTEELLKEVSKCKPDELENLLEQIETKIKKSESNNRDLLSAKTMITSRLASMRSK